ncbi:MAG: hypothetical protein GY938_03255 [Ketobacter sp.]|nr:hypothetical protein [Ketobacter sp.]
MSEKKPRLFYLEESIPAWVPAPENIESIVEVADIELDEVHVIEFRRVDLTDDEYENLPGALGRWR